MPPSCRDLTRPKLAATLTSLYENELGKQAKRRMAELLRTPGLTIENSGEVDRFERPLVVLRLPNGRTIGSVLLAEGLAVEWRPGSDNDWRKIP